MEEVNAIIKLRPTLLLAAANARRALHRASAAFQDCEWWTLPFAQQEAVGVFVSSALPNTALRSFHRISTKLEVFLGS